MRDRRSQHVLAFRGGATSKDSIGNQRWSGRTRIAAAVALVAVLMVVAALAVAVTGNGATDHKYDPTPIARQVATRVRCHW